MSNDAVTTHVHARILERDHHTLLHLPRHVYRNDYNTGFNPDAEILGREKNVNDVTCIDRIKAHETELRQLVEGSVAIVRRDGLGDLPKLQDYLCGWLGSSVSLFAADVTE